MGINIESDSQDEGRDEDVSAQTSGSARWAAYSDLWPANFAALAHFSDPLRHKPAEVGG
jgi:hypothetical protein